MSTFAKISTRNKVFILSAASVLSYKMVDAQRTKKQVATLRVVRPMTNLHEATKWTSCFFPRAPAFAEEASEEPKKVEAETQTEDAEKQSKEEEAAKEAERMEQFEADVAN